MKKTKVKILTPKTIIFLSALFIISVIYPVTMYFIRQNNVVEVTSTEQIDATSKTKLYKVSPPTYKYIGEYNYYKMTKKGSGKGSTYVKASVSNKMYRFSVGEDYLYTIIDYKSDKKLTTPPESDCYFTSVTTVDSHDYWRKPKSVSKSDYLVHLYSPINILLMDMALNTVLFLAGTALLFIGYWFIEDFFKKYNSKKINN